MVDTVANGSIGERFGARMAELGVTQEDYERVIADPELADRVAAAFKQCLEKPTIEAKVEVTVKPEAEIEPIMVVPEMADPQFIMDMRPSGWKLLGDNALPPELPIKYIDILDQKQYSITGRQARIKADSFGKCAGQAQAEYLLEHQDQIPTAVLPGYTVIFFGTTWSDENHRLTVIGLKKKNDKWQYEWIQVDKITLSTNSRVAFIIE